MIVIILNFVNVHFLVDDLNFRETVQSSDFYNSMQISPRTRPQTQENFIAGNSLLL
jgi:hypothetical protein